jgi:hypothetical protein
MSAGLLAESRSLPRHIASLWFAAAWQAAGGEPRRDGTQSVVDGGALLEYSEPMSQPLIHVSTVNNTETNFRVSNDPINPSWNPGGSGRWTVTGCTVTGGVRRDGSTVDSAEHDPVIGQALSQNDSAVLVDLDTEQQLVSQIWGMRLQLGNPAVFRGAFKTVAFTDLWRSRALAGDVGMTAAYHSVLTGVAWGQVGTSQLLAELQQDSDEGLLSIKFNVDGFNFPSHSGRIVGTIGPARAAEPEHFVLGRHCQGRDAGPLSYFPALVEPQRGKLVVDLGNALQTTTVGGPFNSTVDLEIGVLTAEEFHPLGRVPIGGDNWYEQTAGVCEFPPDRALSSAELNELAANPIAVRQNGTGDATGWPWRVSTAST